MRGKPNPFASSEFVVLGLLYEKPTHGYDLHKQITDPDNIGMIWHINMSNLYAQLEKLEQKGFITGVIHSGETHPNRTEYHITQEGQQAFVAWLETVVSHPRDFRQEFMARYFYLLRLFPKKTIPFCQRQLAECKTWLANISELQQKGKQRSIFKSSVIDFRIAQIGAILQWLEKIQNQPMDLTQ
jgi:PadR family transcriptional regulator, regulatory protein AphA